MAMKPRIIRGYTFKKNSTELLVPICIAALLLAFLTSRIPGCVQFSIMLASVTQFAAAAILITGLRSRRLLMITFGGILFVVNLLSSGLTGYKEGVIVNVLLLTFLLFPFYKRAVFVLAIPVICIVLYILPTLASTIRLQVWTGADTAADATADAYLILSSEDPLDQIKTTNWEFLTNRFSEIGMFTAFISSVPEKHGYFSFEILENSVMALIPRVLWDAKPDTEEVSMKRVYDAGVINRLSAASAKTRPIVDGYLSGGKPGVFLSMLLYGLLCQGLCNKAEQLFGGYDIGCVIVFNGIFQQLWRGNNFEFLINNIFYGYLLMMLIFLSLRLLRILVPSNGENTNTYYGDHSNQPFL
jgi:hypothetical protein